MAAPGRGPGDVFRALDADVRRRASLVSDHLCPECLGETTVSIREDVPDEWGIEVIPQFRCTHCSYWFHPPFGLLALDESAVIEFFERHGVDLSDRPYWDCSLCVDPEQLTVDSRDPWRVDLSATRGDETLCVSFDGAATVRTVTIDS